MANFIKDIAKIKMTKIAKENGLDYANIYNERAKKEDIEKFEKELRKKILISMIIETLNDNERIALLEIRDFLNSLCKENDGCYTCDQNTINSIYLIYKMFEV